MAQQSSVPMIQARKLVEEGQTPYLAAKTTGITPSAIYKSKWYKEMKECQKKTD